MTALPQSLILFSLSLKLLAMPMLLSVPLLMRLLARLLAALLLQLASLLSPSLSCLTELHLHWGPSSSILTVSYPFTLLLVVSHHSLFQVLRTHL
jgi:hypothetical protein